jgi:hypothetical protein
MNMLLDDLGPDQLYALATNPASQCRAAAIQALRDLKSPLAKKFDLPKPVVRKTVVYGQPKEKPAPDPTEAISAISKMPVDMLLDIAAATAVYPKTIRLEAARLIKQRSPAARFRAEQSRRVAEAEQAKVGNIGNHQKLAAAASAAFTGQLDRKIAIRMENDKEFAAIMNEVA